MITPEQCRAARALLGWRQTDLAKKAGVAYSTLRNFETQRTGILVANLAAIEGALTASGIVFIPANGGGVGVRLAK